jgi:hypothetical protein
VSNWRSYRHQDSENPDLLYIQGPCYVDLGQLDKGMDLLHYYFPLAPGACARLHGQALGHMRAGEPKGLHAPKGMPSWLGGDRTRDAHMG